MMKRTFIAALFATGLLFAGQAFALDLSEARAQGIVGEQRDGYITMLKPAAEGKALVDEINARRRNEYAKISAQNGQPVGVVGAIAAEKIIEGLPAGSMYQNQGGAWRRK